MRVNFLNAYQQLQIFVCLKPLSKMNISMIYDTNFAYFLCDDECRYCIHKSSGNFSILHSALFARKINVNGFDRYK